MRLLLAFALLAAPACAQEALDATGFAALVEGRTVLYSADKRTPYGREHYFPGGAVAWLPRGATECQHGTWYESRPDGPDGPPLICFAYAGDPNPACWRVEARGAGVVAFDAEGGWPLYELKNDKGPLVCGGVGV